jgi:hypothetical protein
MPDLTTVDANELPRPTSRQPTNGEKLGRRGSENRTFGVMQTTLNTVIVLLRALSIDQLIVRVVLHRLARVAHATVLVV